MKQIAPVILIMFLFSCHSVTTPVLAKDSTTISIVATEDQEMNAAISTARQSLSKFDSALASHNPRYTFFALKVRFPYGNDNGEHIWLNEITKSKGAYSGIINNSPEYITHIKLGDTVAIDK